MSDWLLLLLCCLTVYRLARMVAKEDGPFAVFTLLRNQFTNDKDWVAIGLRCPLCIGFWLALPAGWAYALLSDMHPWAWPLAWWGIAGGAVVIRKWWLERDE